MSQSNSKSLLQELFSDHAPGLLNFLTRKYQNHDLAEDVTQTAFARLSNEKTLSNIKNLRGYLYRMAENLVVDHIRHEKVKERYLESQKHHKQHIETNAPEEAVEAQRQLGKLQESLERLPENCRTAFIYHRIHGLSYNDIAVKMDVSVSSVEKYMLHALRSCREAVRK